MLTLEDGHLFVFPCKNNVGMLTSSGLTQNEQKSEIFYKKGVISRI